MLISFTLPIFVLIEKYLYQVFFVCIKISSLLKKTAISEKLFAHQKYSTINLPTPEITVTHKLKTINLTTSISQVKIQFEFCFYIMFSKQQLYYCAKLAQKVVMYQQRASGSADSMYELKTLPSSILVCMSSKNLPLHICVSFIKQFIHPRTITPCWVNILVLPLLNRHFGTLRSSENFLVSNIWNEFVGFKELTDHITYDIAGPRSVSTARGPSAFDLLFLRQLYRH